jgi:hypothetical protein
MAGVGRDDAAENALQSAPELHGIQWSDRKHFGVEAKERHIGDYSGSTAVLWNHPHGRETEARQVLNLCIGQHDPLLLVDHIGELGAKKIHVLRRRAVGTALQGCFLLLDRPRRCR